MNKITLWGVIPLILIISSFSGCIGSVISWDNVQETHTISVLSIESDSCNISVNGVSTTYKLPAIDNNIAIQGLKEGNNHVIVTCNDQKGEFDITVPVATAPTPEVYDEFNRDYWKSRLS